ncbi:hypothetical protein SAY86_012094 [Trapa natans]|uniref:HMA domain-containing protein n=1 Tax=Trapa natans TaxID=22666 RepID=A0AAN7LWM2_TRANT|nr:hypothetical protein SAY86_012094 [Trapa natans]
MSKQEEVTKLQTCVLRVNIHCEGCKKKVKKLLQKIEGVYKVTIDSEQGKVTVTGIVDSNILVKKLEKSGKHAVLWGSSKNFPNQNNVGFNNQTFNNNSVNNGKLGKIENKSKKDGGNKGGQQHQHQQQLQQKQVMKGLKDMKMVPTKEQKTVKFNLPLEDDFDVSRDAFDDGSSYDDEGSSDEFADDFGHGHPQKPFKPSNVKGGQIGQKGNKGKDKNQKKGGSGGKKGSLFDMIKGFGMKSYGKHGSGGTKNGDGGNGKSKGGGEKDGDKNVGFLQGFSKNVNFSEVAVVKNRGNGGNGNGGGGGGSNNSVAKKSGGKNNEGSHLRANNKIQASFKDANNQQRGAEMPDGGEGSFMNQMGSMGPMMNHPMGQVGGMPAFQGLPGMGGGCYQNPYQHPYMGMMMNHHQQNPGLVNGMYPPMMYGRPPQPVGYVPPMPPPASDPYVHMFNDENTESCVIM